ncbi:hypothetical protein BS17DRAFT_770854, partial [Gyrodon lividus]
MNYLTKKKSNSFRKDTLSTQSPDPSLPHYFTLVFHYDVAIAYVLGRQIGEGCEEFNQVFDNWETWMGPLYWIWIAALHGFDTGDPREVMVVTHNWPQNGQDCGPTTCSLLKHLMDHGFSIDNGDLHLPPIPCGHILHWRMLGAIREACQSSWQNYNLLTSSRLPPHDIWTAWDDTMFVTEEDLVAMENEVSGKQYAPVVQDLNIASTNCAICLRAPCPIEVAGDYPPEISAEDDHPPRDVNEDQDEDRTDPFMKAQHLRKLFRLHPDTICARCRDWLPPHAIKERLPEEEDLGNHPQHVKDWSKGTMFCFPQPTPPVHLPAYKRHRWLPFDVKFDKYKGTPVYKSMKPYRNPYVFRQMFYLKDLVSVLDHVLVVEVADDYDPSLQVSDHVIGAYSLRRHPDFYPGDNDHVDVSDVFVYGAAEMLALGAINSEQSFNAFVR